MTKACLRHRGKQERATLLLCECVEVLGAVGLELEQLAPALQQEHAIERDQTERAQMTIDLAQRGWPL